MLGGILPAWPGMRSNLQESADQTMPAHRRLSSTRPRRHVSHQWALVDE
jgi:hypothetical protein